MADQKQPTKAEVWLHEHGIDPDNMLDMFGRMALDFGMFLHATNAPPGKPASRAFHRKFRKSIHDRVMRDIEELRIRDEFIREFGFAVLTRRIVEAIRPYGPLVEIGSGTGYWAHELCIAGIDVFATDKHPPLSGRNTWFHRQWCDIKAMDSIEAVKEHPQRNLLTCWPSIDEPWAAETLRQFRGQYVLYEGEHRGATADDVFHDLLEKKFLEEKRIQVPRFFGLRDYLGVWRRKTHRTRL